MRRLADEGAQVLDVRPSADFGAGHVPGSLNVGLGGQFASWSGTLLDPARPLVVVADDEARVREAVMRLARVGLENVAGYLDGGVAAWDRAGPARRRPAADRGGGAERAAARSRRPAGGGRAAAGRVRRGPRARARRAGPSTVSRARCASLDPARPTAVICAGGYRSSAATSILRRHGFRDLVNVVGGTSAWVAAGYEVETPGRPRRGVTCAAVAAVLLLLTVPAPGSTGDRMDGKAFATRSVVYARHGMVAAAHPLAVQAGVDMLKKGGSAVDAAIAVNAALGFLEPVACGHRRRPVRDRLGREDRDGSTASTPRAARRAR